MLVAVTYESLRLSERAARSSRASILYSLQLVFIAPASSSFLICLSVLFRMLNEVYYFYRLIHSISTHGHNDPTTPDACVDDKALSQLLDMGFPLETSRNALTITRGNMDEATNLLVSSPERYKGGGVGACWSSGEA